LATFRLNPVKYRLVPDSPATIASNILEVIRYKIDTVLTAAARSIEPQLRKLIYQRLYDSPAVQSMLNDVGRGGLRAELGMADYADAATLLSPILETWSQNIEFTTIPAKQLAGKISAGFRMGFIDASWNDVLSLPQAEYVSLNSKGQSNVVPWLEWLLLKGDEPLADFFIRFGDYPKRSRSGFALMVRKFGASWQVPANFQGTADDNFVIKALNGIQHDLRKIIRTEIERRL